MRGLVGARISTTRRRLIEGRSEGSSNGLDYETIALEGEVVKVERGGAGGWSILLLLDDGSLLSRDSESVRVLQRDATPYRG